MDNNSVPRVDDYVWTGGHIAAVRKAAKLSQRQLAAIVGCTQNNIFRWETGAVEPGAQKLYRLAQALDCTIDDLI